jgi:general secretion pathway protein K
LKLEVDPDKTPLISKKSLPDSRGVALIMVLWVMVILSVVALEFSFAMRTEITITKNHKEDLQRYAMAEGGVQRAIAELIYKHDPRTQQMKKTLSLEEISPEQQEWVADGRPYTVSFDQGSCEIRIMSEAGKININLVSESLLRKVIGQLGLEGEARDVVVDSILDWRDPNDLYRANGAENDYYLSLKEPYYCKNGNLDAIEELLLIKGVTPELYHGKKGTQEGEEGTTDRVGLKDLFSIYAPGEQVDINSATLLVINMVLGIPREVSQQMVKAREEKSFENQQDLLNRVPELAPFIGEIGRFIVYRSALPYYTIESRAKLKEGSPAQGLKTTVKIDPREKERYKIVQWVDRLMER